MADFGFVLAGSLKPESDCRMDGRRGLLLSLIMAACFYGNTSAKTGGCDYVAVTSLPAYQRIKDVVSFTSVFTSVI